MDRQLYALMGPSSRNVAVRRLRAEAEAHAEVVTLLTGQGERLLAPELRRVDFDPGYELPGGEVFAVRFELPDALAAVTKAPDQPADLTRKELEDGRLLAIVAMDTPWSADSSQLVLQAMDARLTIKPKDRLALMLHANTFTKATTPGITLGSQVDAVLVGGLLLMTSPARVRTFLDIAPVLEPATDTQVRELAAHPLLAVDDVEALLEAADQVTRRRVSSLLHHKVLDRVTVPRVVEVAKGFGIDAQVTTVDGIERLRLPTERADLKDLVDVLDDNIFDSRLTGFRYVAASKRRWKRRQG